MHGGELGRAGIAADLVTSRRACRQAQVALTIAADLVNQPPTW